MGDILQNLNDPERIQALLQPDGKDMQHTFGRVFGSSGHSDGRSPPGGSYGSYGRSAYEDSSSGYIPSPGFRADMDMEGASSPASTPLDMNAQTTTGRGDLLTAIANGSAGALVDSTASVEGSTSESPRESGESPVNGPIATTNVFENMFTPMPDLLTDLSGMGFPVDVVIEACGALQVRTSSFFFFFFFFFSIVISSDSILIMIMLSILT